MGFGWLLVEVVFKPFLSQFKLAEGVVVGAVIAGYGKGRENQREE